MPDAGAQPFTTLPLTDGCLLELPGLRVYGLAGGRLDLRAPGTAFGMLTGARAQARLGGQELELRADMFFVEPGEVQLHGGHGLVIQCLNYAGQRQIGGPLEARGRLTYIDGCSDSLLVCPPRLGEPCLNHLHIPAHTTQSTHTHPSVRIGVIARGRGSCATATARHALQSGLGWYIPAGLPHAFYTEAEALDVIAFHPTATSARRMTITR